jgi:tetratricopeptide (TPR) repeat protein
VRGVLELIDEKKRHWIRHDGIVLPYPGGRVRDVDEIRMPSKAVYTPEELYFLRLERFPPVTPRQHVDLARRMFDVGNWTRAKEHYEAARSVRPDWASELTPRIAEIEDILEDSEAQVHYRKAKVRAVLFGDYLGAIRDIEDYIALHPAAKRRGLLVINEIREKRMEKLLALYHRAKAEAFDRCVRRHLVRKAPTIEEAMNWVLESAADEVDRRVRGRLELNEEEVAMLKESRAKCAPHWATYKCGTFVISERAVKGRTTKRTIRGDPETWWEAFPDVNTRSTFLKAFGAERLPHLFEVVQIRHTPCTRCGGKGSVRIFSFRSNAQGKHTHRQTCPRCFGAKEDRGVGYR